jgi:hypothetical protein
MSMFIRLITKEPLTSSNARMWYQAVKECLGAATLGSMQIDGKMVKMIRRTVKEGLAYDIPTIRHPRDTELEEIFEAADAALPEGDFLVEGSQDKIRHRGDIEVVEIDINSERYKELCESLAKHQHSQWVSQRTDAGWRYGLSESSKERTHPLLRPWEQLPESYRKVDYKLPGILLEFLSSQGYTVVKDADLTALLLEYGKMKNAR